MTDHTRHDDPSRRPLSESERADLDEIVLEVEADVDAFFAQFDEDEKPLSFAGMYFDADGRARTRYRSMKDHPFDPALVALVEERLRHPAFQHFRHRCYEVCDLVSGFPAADWNDAITGLFFDGDHGIRTHHLMLRVL